MAAINNWRDAGEEHNRRLVLEGRQVLERTSASLARSNQIAIETENIGTEVRTKTSAIFFILSYSS